MKLVTLAALAAMISAPALAFDLTVKMDEPILDPQGKQMAFCMDPFDLVMPNPGCHDARPETFALVASIALGWNDARTPPDKKLKAGLLAIRMGAAKGSFTFASPEEAALVRDAVPALFDPVTVARIDLMLGGKP